MQEVGWIFLAEKQVLDFSTKFEVVFDCAAGVFLLQ